MSENNRRVLRIALVIGYLMLMVLWIHTKSNNPVDVRVVDFTVETEGLTGISNGIYADCGVILERPGEVVPVTFQNGQVFEFVNNDHDWFVGDLVTVVFYDNGTPEITDDVILRARYSGWIDEEDRESWVR